MIYRLVILNGERRGERITVTHEPMTIGRAETCDIRFNDPEVAQMHAEVSHRPEGLFIRDLGSMNRLLINNREAREVHPKHGDVIEVGQTRFLVQAYVQADVPGHGENEDNPIPYRQWLGSIGAVLLVLGILYAMYQCRPVVKPRGVKAIPPASAGAAAARSKVPDSRLASIPAVAAATNAVPAATNVTKSTGSYPKAEPVAAKPKPARAKPAPPPAALPEETELRAPVVAPTVTAETVARAQRELEQAANALLESKVRDMLDEARQVSTNKGPDAAEPLLAAIEAIKPDFAEASVAHAMVLEEQGKLEPALAIWSNLSQRVAATSVTAQAAAKLKQLSRARETMVFPFVGRIKITGSEINKFPENDQHREMRLLTLKLVATELQKEIRPEAVRVEVRFYDRDPQSGRITPTDAEVKGVTVPGPDPWRATEEKSFEASYVVPAGDRTAARPVQYYGFAVRVYYYGALQDERIHPQDLPADIDLAVPPAEPAAAAPEPKAEPAPAIKAEPVPEAKPEPVPEAGDQPAPEAKVEPPAENP